MSTKDKEGDRQEYAEIEFASENKAGKSECNMKYVNWEYVSNEFQYHSSYLVAV